MHSVYCIVHIDLQFPNIYILIKFRLPQRIETVSETDKL